MKNLCLILIVFALSISCDKQCFESDKCELKGEPGGCRANIPSYYFNKNTNRCVEFIWGGCEGVRPFASMEECVESCHCVD